MMLLFSGVKHLKDIYRGLKTCFPQLKELKSPTGIVMSVQAGVLGAMCIFLTSTENIMVVKNLTRVQLCERQGVFNRRLE